MTDWRDKHRPGLISDAAGPAAVFIRIRKEFRPKEQCSIASSTHLPGESELKAEKYRQHTACMGLIRRKLG